MGNSAFANALRYMGYIGAERKELIMAVVIDREKCINCKGCYERCPEESFGIDSEGKVFVKYPEECWLCGACEMDCPVKAIKVLYETPAGSMFL